MNDIHLKVLKALEDNPEISQRELSQKMGVSLGKANYCLKALLDKGLVKAINFKNSNNKIAYRYFLTPSGIQEKTSLSIKFLKKKMAEFELLKDEIAQLEKETSQHIMEEK